MLKKSLVALWIAWLVIPSLAAQGVRLTGVVATEQDGSFLPGVELNLYRLPADELLYSVLSGEEGRFLFVALEPGEYRLTAALPGFETLEQQVVVGQQQVPSLTLKLKVSGVEQSVEVVGVRRDEPETGTSAQTLKADLVNIAPVQGDDFGDLLPLLPGVLRASDGRIVMKGGGATQSSLVVNSSTNVTDPVTGNFGFNLPSDAIENVEVLPNPYAAEFGRFSAGVTNILTRQGTEKWKFTFNNFFPRPKFRDGTILGIGGFTPRLGFRGPLIKERLFVAQTFQYRYLQTRVPGQPVLRNDTRLESFDSFSQIDAVINEKHSVSGIISFFPRKLDFVNLDSFNPQEVTPNFHQRGFNIGLSERAVLSEHALIDSVVSFKRYDVDIFGQGLGEMRITPDGNLGNFFNLQRRQTETLQWVENFTFVKQDWGGDHLFKFGFDMLRASFTGTSESRPVRVIRNDGTLSRSIEFLGSTEQDFSSTDLAFYGQDRWRINDRLLLELGGRIDRDGVLEQTHFSPRLGFVLGVLPGKGSFLRGGAGIFYERTPLSVGAFPSFERRMESTFGSDGTTPIGEPLVFDFVYGEKLRTPYSFTWNLEYDHRVNEKLLLKANYLRRSGFHEFLLDRIEGDRPELRLETRGRSRYWEFELTGRYDISPESYLILSYVRSDARRDLNAFDDYFGNFRRPIIRPNEYSLADTDTPHRFLLQGSVVTPGKWIVSPVVEVRTGFPYSLVDENQFFVGPRNLAGRFPRQTTLDLDVQRWFKIWKWKTRIGFRIFNLFNTFNPRNVQGNLDSTQFGVFSNTIPRKFGATFQIEP